MSTGHFYNLKDQNNKSVPTTYITDGSAKAWVRGNSAASVSDSLNVSSGTDHGTGRYSYALTSAFAATVVRAVTPERSSSLGLATAGSNSLYDSTSVISIYCGNPTSAIDLNNNLQAWGDLA